MPDWLIEVHSIFRWVVLPLALAALAFAVMAATGSRPWDALSDRLAMFFTIAMDVQLLIGLILWVLEGRWASADLGVTWLHPLAMIGAVGLAHVGRARSDRVEGSRNKGMQAAIFFGLSLLLVLVGIPLYSWPV